MAHFKVHRLAAVIFLLAVTSSAKEQSRWSRQISSYTADVSDWVPLSGPVEREPPLPPIKRQAVAEPRILTEPFPGISRPTGFDAFPSRTYYNTPSNRQLYLQSVPAVPSAPQNFLTDQGFGQSIRFGLQQPNFPLSQGFISPQFGYENIPQMKPKFPQQTAPVKFENYVTKMPQNPPIAAPTKSFNNQVKLKPEAPKFVDGYRAENSSNDFYNQKKKLQPHQKIKFENFDRKPEQHSSPKVEREEVQLLYVPVESLNRGHFNFRSPITNSHLMNMDLYSQGVQRPFKQVHELHKPVPKPIDNFSDQNYFNEFNSPLMDIDQIPKFSTLSSPFPSAPPTTPKPKKLKPHQPPLAIFLSEDSRRRNQMKVGDVLNSLKHANSVAVLDSVNPLNAPKVFIGPSSLKAPEKYVKFELPYLSNIENTDKKLRQLPFFVAPLSYNTPQGFAKIPFPSPHVGSVVINAQIRDTNAQGPSNENVQPNYYTGHYKQEPKQPINQKPTVSFYSTVPPPKPNVDIQPNYQSNYYSFEPQTVSTLRPLNEPEVEPPKESYYLNNAGAQYTFLPQSKVYPITEHVQSHVASKHIETTTTQRTTVSTTTKPPSTYPSQLLETHNPYSINQAFHFSTPLDYHTYFEEYKEPAATPGDVETLTPSLQPSVTTSKVEEVPTEKNYQQQTSQNNMQSYSPEIHYESEVHGSRYPTYSSNEHTTQAELAETYSPVKNDNIAELNPPQYTQSQEAQTPVPNDSVTEVEKRGEQYEYNQYDKNSNNEDLPVSSTTSTSTTTSRPVRKRGRPRYPSTIKPESGEYSTRAAATRRPLRERKPLPTRRYEPNRITTEKPTRKPIDYSSGESTTKSSRTRTRGRIQYKPNDSDESDNRRNQNKKDQDLAYQRDVLHQNYPVTIQERMSTVDIEAITEPSSKTSIKNAEYVTESYDTENAYTNEKIHSVSPFSSESDSKEDIPVFPTRNIVAQTENSNTPKPSTRNEEYLHQSKVGVPPTESYEETITVREEDLYSRPTTVQKEEPVYATESITLSEQNGASYSINNEYSSRHETTTPESEATTVVSQEEEEENVVQTTPSYNRVRVRPGVIRQYHQASSESPKVKTDRRRPVTYRPAFDKRRTTMRIDEIEADLKTKQVHGHQEHDYRHPVYKPEPTTEATSTQEEITKRGQFRRRRPSYTTSTTEGSPTSRNKYEVKNRFRGRRPTTEKPSEQPEVQTDTSTTIRPLYNRYSSRPRLSDRYNKKPEPEETRDQDSNYSYNRPQYVEPETDIWSPKISTDSFKPYNPNDIVDDQKFATTERRSDREELDIITAKNEYEDMLISVTPATNNRNNKKIPDIPPTLEALVEQSKVTKSDSGDSMSTFETMLEEVMKSLEEQDEDEYSSNVMKHKGGEIGEIPPERVITSGDANTQKTTPIEQVTATVEPHTDATQSNEDESTHKNHRRGFWKKVKVRPLSTESIEAAESQYYHNTVNRFEQPLRQSHEKANFEKPRVGVTTYKPAIEFIKDIFSNEDEDVAKVESMEITKLTTNTEKYDTKPTNEDKPTTATSEETYTEKYVSPGELDLGTGTPDPTIDNLYSTSTEPTTASKEVDNISKVDGFSFMDYLFGVTSEEEIEPSKNVTVAGTEIEITTEVKPSMMTTESSYIPEEITEVAGAADNVSKVEEVENTSKATEMAKVEQTTKSTFMNVNVMSTSMSTEVSHETEICFRGKCIKTSKDIL